MNFPTDRLVGHVFFVPWRVLYLAAVWFSLWNFLMNHYFPWWLYGISRGRKLASPAMRGQQKGISLAQNPPKNKIIKTSTFWKTKKYLWNLLVCGSQTKGFQNSTDFGVKQPPIIYPFIKPFIGAPCHSFHLFTKSSRRVHLVGIAEVFLCSSSLVVSLCLRNLAWKRRAWE